MEPLGEETTDLIFSTWQEEERFYYTHKDQCIHGRQ